MTLLQIESITFLVLLTVVLAVLTASNKLHHHLKRRQQIRKNRLPNNWRPENPKNYRVYDIAMDRRQMPVAEVNGDSPTSTAKTQP